MSRWGHATLARVGHVKNAAAATMARYRNESWFRSAEPARDRVVLRVTHECPFREHRQVASVPVAVERVGE